MADTLKLWTDEQAADIDYRERRRLKGRRPRAVIDRCRNCNKPARWPGIGKPLFCTRICGYRMACRIIQESEAKDA
jgi:hypothetical protein